MWPPESNRSCSRFFPNTQFAGASGMRKTRPPAETDSQAERTDAPECRVSCPDHYSQIGSAHDDVHHG
jgi:hypothetical protein